MEMDEFRSGSTELALRIPCKLKKRKVRQDIAEKIMNAYCPVVHGNADHTNRLAQKSNRRISYVPASPCM